MRPLFFWYRKTAEIREKNKVLSGEEIKKFVALLREGKVISFPTETVYALAGDARNLSAIKKIFKLKNRPPNQPLSVLFPKNYDFTLWVDHVSPRAQRLADHFWPGPLTLILNKNESVLSELTAGQSKIGLRVPDHSIAQAILQAFAGGLAAPSANRSAHLSPTVAAHVQEEFGEQLNGIIDGGVCNIGIESTIIDVTTTIPSILRLGAISVKEIQNIIHCEVIHDGYISASGRLVLQQIASADLPRVISNYLNQGKSVTVLARHSSFITHKNLFWIVMPAEASSYTQVLYQHLHKAEQNLTNEILVESVPMHESWSGIRSILNKYSA